MKRAFLGSPDAGSPESANFDLHASCAIRPTRPDRTARIWLPPPSLYRRCVAARPVEARRYKKTIVESFAFLTPPRYRLFRVNYQEPAFCSARTGSGGQILNAEVDLSKGDDAGEEGFRISGVEPPDYPRIWLGPDELGDDVRVDRKSATPLNRPRLSCQQTHHGGLTYSMTCPQVTDTLVGPARFELATSCTPNPSSQRRQVVTSP